MEEQRATQYDLKVYQHTAPIGWQLEFVKDDASLDITDYTIFFTVKSDPKDEDDDALIKKDITTHSSPTEGKTLISLTTSDTNIDVGSYYYDIKYKDGNGNQDILFYGKFEVQRPITKRTS